MTNMALVVSLILSTPQLRCGDSDLGRCVRDSLFNEIVRLDRAADAAWAACDTPERLAGTLGLLVKSEHPALAGFPTSFHSDYQWRELIFNGVNVVLDDDKDVDVIVRGIDNITRNQNLGVIWEKRRGKGRVLYCSLDLEAVKNLPEARALRRSLLDYLQAEHDHWLFSTCSTRLNERKK